MDYNELRTPPPEVDDIIEVAIAELEGSRTASGWADPDEQCRFLAERLRHYAELLEASDE